MSNNFQKNSEKLSNSRIDKIRYGGGLYSLGQADVILRHAKGKIMENRVHACALLSTHTDTHGTKGKKGTISRMSNQANTNKGKAYVAFSRAAFMRSFTRSL